MLEIQVRVAPSEGFRTGSGHSRRAVSHSNPQDILPILWMVKTPHQQQSSVSDRNVESIDLLPTVADVLGIEVPWPIDGQSTLDHSLPERLRKESWWAPDRFLFDGPFESKYESAAHTMKNFCSGADPIELFRIGPHSELVGRRLDELNVVPESNIAVSIENQQMLDPNVYANELLLPCLLRGRVQVESPSQLPVAMAVAVNGKICAVTRTYVLEDHKDQWFAMLPEDAFTAESFDLQLFQISTVDDSIQLAPVRVLNE